MSVKVGIFTDPHCSLREISTKTRRPVLSLGKIKRIMDIFKAEGVEYVLCLGDLVDDCGGEEATACMLKIIKDLVESYGIPFYSILGNHDCACFVKDKLHEILDMPAEPCSMRVGDSLFVFLDANFYDDGTSYCPEEHLWTNSAIPTEQLDFYAKEWQATDAENVFVFMHENADPDVEHRHIIRNAEQVRAELAKCPKLKGVYQGHYHWGHENVVDGIPYHTLPAVCEGENMPYVIFEA